jgi:aspartyl-tRNA(Asn)/glutamyl-tRNA(Gln) amidotransferase subunit A
MPHDDVFFVPVADLAARIRSRKLSPVSLTEQFLDRGQTLGPKFSAYVTITSDLALEQAHRAEKEIAAGHYRGPLHGIPYAAKDLFAVRGYPTTWGAKPYADQRFDYDAAVIERLTAAGAILLGKAAMIELAGAMGYRYASASLTGAAKNPWSAACWTGGSSSGSGAIVSASLAPFAIGTETWGSIICPSAFCGISGFRPTFGRVSRFGAMALAYSMDKVGPMCRTAEDCQLVLKVLAGHDPRDLSSLPAAEASLPASSRLPNPLRVAWLTNAWASCDPEIQSAARAAVEVLRAHGAQVTEAALPVNAPAEDAATMIVSVESAAAFRKLIVTGRIAQLADPLGRLAGFVNAEMRADDYVRALQTRAICQRQVDSLFDSFDVIAAPSLPIAATALDANLETDLGFADLLGALGNLAGLPAISVPCGFTGKNLPIGIQFAARARNDLLVLQTARLFQRYTDWHTRRPALA